MKIITKPVDESQLEEIAALMQNDESSITLERSDIESILVGKEGSLYHAAQDEGVDNSTFMTDFFNELKKKDQVLACSSILIRIGMSQDNPLLFSPLGHPKFQTPPLTRLHSACCSSLIPSITL